MRRIMSCTLTLGRRKADFSGLVVLAASAAAAEGFESTPPPVEKSPNNFLAYPDSDLGCLLSAWFAGTGDDVWLPP